MRDWTNVMTDSPKGTYTKADNAIPEYATMAESENVLSVSDASCVDWCPWFSQLVNATA